MSQHTCVYQQHLYECPVCVARYTERCSIRSFVSALFVAQHCRANLPTLPMGHLYSRDRFREYPVRSRRPSPPGLPTPARTRLHLLRCRADISLLAWHFGGWPSSLCSVLVRHSLFTLHRHPSLSGYTSLSSICMQFIQFFYLIRMLFQFCLYVILGVDLSLFRCCQAHSTRRNLE